MQDIVVRSVREDYILLPGISEGSEMPKAFRGEFVLRSVIGYDVPLVICGDLADLCYPEPFVDSDVTTRCKQQFEVLAAVQRHRERTRRIVYLRKFAIDRYLIGVDTGPDTTRPADVAEVRRQAVTEVDHRVD